MPETTSPPVTPAVAYQPKQYVGQLNGSFGFVFDVFETGDSRYWLLVCTRNCDIRTAKLKADFKPEVRRMLNHGWGHAPRPAAAAS